MTASPPTTPARPAPEPRTAYPRLFPMTTRLRDNDAYGHLNNVVYGEYFDTAVNQALIESGVLDMNHSELIGLVVQANTSYFKPVAFPDRVTIGLRVGRVGRTSVTYEFAMFREDDPSAAAQGSYTHAYVSRASNQPVELPAAFRAALQALMAG